MKYPPIVQRIGLAPPKSYHPTWSEQAPDGRWRRYSYEELVARDKANLDIFWLRDEGIDDGDHLLDPDVLAAEIVEDLAAALEQFREIVADLEERYPVDSLSGH